MNAGIVRKTWRDTRLLLLIAGAGIVLFEALIVGVARELARDIAALLDRLPLVRRLMGMLVGAELGDQITIMTFMSFGFVHPVLLTLTWAFLLTVCSRLPAGEIDRGTADLLLTLPVSRARVYVSASVVWVLCGLPLSLAPLVGVAIGRWLFEPPEPLDLARLALLCVNLYALYLAVGAAATLASSLASRRGTAVAVLLGLLLASFLLNFLSQFWSVFEDFAFLGLLRYYRPLLVVRTGHIEWADVTVLVTAAIVAWTAGLWRFARRDIPAV